mgnify:CR=1 FL=1
MFASKRASVKQKHYLYSYKIPCYGSFFLFVIYGLLNIAKEINTAGLTLGDVLVQSLAGSFAAVGAAWLVPYFMNLAYRFYKKRNLNAMPFTNMWLVSSLFIILGAIK